MKAQNFAILAQDNAFIDSIHAADGGIALNKVRQSKIGKEAGSYVASGWRAIPFAQYEQLRDKQNA